MQAVMVSVVTSLYHGIDYLAAFLAELPRQSIFPQLELVLVHNAPLSEELDLVRDFTYRYPQQVQHIIVDPVETLAASWNRGWQAAQGEFIALWNVDDRRAPDSLERQMHALQVNPATALSYGDFIIVARYGDEGGARVRAADFSFKTFSRDFPGSGAFMVFRKTMAAAAGPFDEQLKCCVDFEFSVRLCLNRMTFCKTAGLMGWFTNEKRGLSTINGEKLTLAEDCLVQLRYGIFDKIKFEWMKAAANYAVDSIIVNGQAHSVREFVPDYDHYVRSRQWLWKVAGIKNAVRRFLLRLGVWNWYVRNKMRLTGRISPE